MTNMKAARLFLGLALWAMVIGFANAYEECGSLQNAYGPFDYWSDKDKLGIVEGAHFTPDVENLVKGQSGDLGRDIDYTLRAFPNHPRALFTVVRFGEKSKKERPRGVRYTVRCYLERAIRFRPNDATARMIYGIYLVNHKKNTEALAQLEVAKEHAGDNANLHYNLGLLYFDLGKYDKALKHAHVAYRMGFNLPGLRGKLEKEGKWQDLPPTVVPTEVLRAE